MFVRKRRNKSGTTSVVVVDKSSGRFKELTTIGVASTSEEIAELEVKAQRWIDHYGGQQTFDFEESEKAMEEIRRTISMIERTLQNAPQVILGHVYDRLYNTQQEKIQKISVSHTLDVLGGRIGLVFYDVTTLYFESAPDPSDELRQDGFSKDGKTAESQIVLGLLVSEDGYPLSYSVFNGKQYEGYTMIPIIDDFVQRFNLTDFIVVADSGLMSENNVNLLESAGYKYILGARIRSESPKVKKWLLDIDREDGHCAEYVKRAGQRLIVSYSEARAKKNAHNREKGVARLRKAYAKGTLTKDKVNKRGYNKFLDISKDVMVSINYDKIAEDARWDGLKGYITNTNLDAKEVIKQYHGLWVVERAFRIGKSNLEMRPMFHFTPKRIEAHICICFVAYKVYKELERTLRMMEIGMSVDKVLFIAKTITTLKIRLPNGELYTETLYNTPQQAALKPLIEGVAHARK